MEGRAIGRVSGIGDVPTMPHQLAPRHHHFSREAMDGRETMTNTLRPLHSGSHRVLIHGICFVAHLGGPQRNPFMRVSDSG